MSLEVFLDDTPGETRAVIARDGRFERLLIERPDDRPEHQPGARLFGRAYSVQPGAGGVFVDLGGPPPHGYLPLKRATDVREGEAIEVEVTAGPRDRKGPTLRRLGPASGPPRLLEAAPDLATRVAALGPGVAPVTGVAAIQASWDAEEEAMGAGDFFSEHGLDLALQRTRALVAVDLDLTVPPGRDVRRARDRANQEGLRQAARLIRLKGWGGLVLVDLVGGAQDGEAVGRWTRDAFAGDGATVGPVSRFGTVQLALPWTGQPIEARLNDDFGRPSLQTRAVEAVRCLRHSLLSDPSIPRLRVACAPDEAEAAAPLVAQLGPRASIRPDPACTPGRCAIEEVP